MDIIFFLQRIPAVVWSGLVASFVTLMGVMLSNASNTKRLLRQLKHDGEQKQRDRMAALHKDVYLKAAEEIAIANNYLGKLSQLDPANGNLSDGLTALFAACAKAQLIAQPEASKLLGDLSTAYGMLLMRLLPIVLPVHNLNNSIRIASDFIQRNQAEAQRVLDEMKQTNESGAMTKDRFDALHRSHMSALERAESFSLQRDDMWKKHAVAARNFNIAMLTEMRAIGQLQARTMAALRSELGLETDMTRYVERIEENWAKVDKEMKAAMDNIAAGDDSVSSTPLRGT